MSKLDDFRAILAIEEVAQNETLRARMEREIEILEKKSVSRQPSKRQKENEELKPVVLEALRNVGEPSTVSDLIKSDGLASLELSTQRVTPILKKLEKEGLVSSAKSGKVSLYSAINTDEQ